MNMNKEVIDRKANITSTITTLLDLHQSEIIPTLAVRLFGDDSTSSIKQAGEMLDAHRQLIESCFDNLSEAHHALLDEAADDEPYRVKRQELSDQLLQSLKDTKNLIDAAYGDTALQHYTLDQDPPESAELLQDYTLEVIRIMTEAPITVPSPHGFDLDFGPIAQKLSETLAPLSTTLEDIRREAQEIIEAAHQFKDAKAEFDETYIGVSEAIHAFCLIAKRPDIAATIQPPDLSE